jgi:hypothetical protein
MCEASTATPRGVLAPVMKLSLTFVPLRSARPIVPAAALPQYTCEPSTATPKGPFAPVMKLWLTLAPVMSARPIVPGSLVRPVDVRAVDRDAVGARSTRDEARIRARAVEIGPPDVARVRVGPVDVGGVNRHASEQGRTADGDEVRVRQRAVEVGALDRAAGGVSRFSRVSRGLVHQWMRQPERRASAGWRA